MARSGYCPHCRKTHTTPASVAGKLLFTVGGGLVTGASSDSIGKTVASSLAGLALGAVVDAAMDEFVTPNCPSCGTALRVAASTLA